MGKTALLLKSIRLSVSVIALVSLTACFNTNTTATGSSSSSKSLSTSSTTTSGVDSCSVFSDSSFDYELCQACLSSTGSTNITTLAQCVHANAGVTGGVSCVGLSCGADQIANFSTCSCEDATATDGGISTPGWDDQSSPILYAGLTIGNRNCTTVGSSDTTYKYQCLLDPGTTSTYSTPKNYDSTPINVFQDTGYIRWDLGMDESQYSPAIPLTNGADLKITSATLAGNFSLYAQLKPNTKFNATTVTWKDCVEHYSGFASGATTYYTTPLECDYTGTTNSSVDLDFSATSGIGTAYLKNLSLNGPAANFNLTSENSNLDTSSSPRLKLGSTYGLSKSDAADTSFPVTNTDLTSLISNIGYYKFTMGPVTVSRPTSTTTIAKNTVTNRVAINTNLGFNPASFIDSSAFSPNAIIGDVTSRTCTGTTNCVVTGVYRSTGGAVLYQSFGPQYTNHSSAVGSLPTGVTAVSTPKIIEDLSQYTASNSTLPSRARVFVRGADGNIYTSKAFHGSWSSWVSLGRPWVANNNANVSGGTSYYSDPVYKPYTNAFAANTLAAPYDTPYSGSYGDGISIVGEPTVVTYTNSTVSPYVGYIAVFVRVSQFNSSDGKPGNYHNTVFYTFTASSSTTYSSSPSSLDFDNTARWSRWMPVVDGSGTPIKIQGNPTAYFGNSSGTISLYVSGTQVVSSNMQPPAAPENDPSGQSTHYRSNLVLSGSNVEFTDSWFNYGENLITVGIPIGTYGGAGTNPGTIGDAETDSILTWSNKTTIDIGSQIDTLLGNNDYDQSAVVSDWTIVRDSAASATYNLMATVLIGNSTTVDTGINGYSVDSNNNVNPRDDNKSPARYRYRTLVVQEMTVSATPISAGASGVASSNFRIFQGPQYYGTPYGVVLATNTIVDPLAKVSCSSEASPCPSTDVTTFTPTSYARILVSGRYICSSSSECDPVNPTASYAVIRQTSDVTKTVNGSINPNEDAQASLYTYGGARLTQADVDDGAESTTYFYTPVQSLYKIMPLYATSDVVPVLSSAQSKMNNEAPLYLFTRDAYGKLSVGVWGSVTSGGVSTGPTNFTFYSTGGFVN